MIRTGELGGERKNILLGRKEESLVRAVKRVYIGEERNTQISAVISREKIKEANQKSNKEGVEKV